MKRIRKGATLLITTLALSVVTITASAFSGVYFRYGKMNNDYLKIDTEKMKLMQNSNVAYEHFLKNTEVEYMGETKKLRTDLLVAEPGLEYQTTLSVTLSNFIANFKAERNDHTLFGLTITGDEYSIYSQIKYSYSRYRLTFINFEKVK